MGDKIDKLIEKCDKINKLIEHRDKIEKFIQDYKILWKTLPRMRNDKKYETSKIFNDHSQRIDQLIERVDALFAQCIAHQRPPPSLESPNLSYPSYQDNTSYFNKIKIEIPKYDGLDN